MCGIAGIISAGTVESAHKNIDKMLTRLARRGPDGSGKHVASIGEGWTVALGHRRLSIIDIGTGQQPMSNEDDTIHITFNGEIFNFKELHQDLVKKGHSFKTRSDTEVIVHNYEELGAGGFNDLNGMFAFGIWDSVKKQLILARDRVGIKPLYYVQLPNGGIAFASELTSIIDVLDGRIGLDVAALQSYFFMDSIPSPQSILSGVKKLRPGEALIYDFVKKSYLVKDFWHLDLRAQSNPTSSDRFDADQLSEDLWSRIKLAVHRQLVADVDVGAFLSGGIDSSIVTFLAAKELGSGLKTFSIGFKDQSFDESSYARVVAKKIGSDHTERILDEENLLGTLDECLNYLDEPLADPSLVPAFLLSRVAADRVKVALGGDGGDELWAGYPTYKAHVYSGYYQKIPRFFRDNLISPLVSSLPVNLKYQSFEWKAKRFALRWAPDSEERHLRWMSNVDLPDLSSLFPNLEQIPFLLNDNAQLGSHLNFNNYLALDFKTYLPNSVLTKVDRASMANSLEVRPPFLDNELIDWSFTQPFNLKYRNGQSKFLLKKAAEKYLPREIIYRPKKGFAIPIGKWLNGPLAKKMDAVFQDSELWKLKAMNKLVFERWLTEHREEKADRSKPLWALLVLDHWIKKENIRAL